MPNCDQIAQELEHLKRTVKQVQASLAGAVGSAKYALVNCIRALNQQIAQQQHALNVCQGTREPLYTQFTGTATITTSYGSAPGPYKKDIVLGIRFDASRTGLEITVFPAITVGPFSTPIGSNTTTITMYSGGRGSFNTDTGAIGLSLALFFNHSADFPLYEEDSKLPLLVGTGSNGRLTGAPFNPATLAVTLVGSGTFREGIMDGNNADVTISGSFADRP